MKNRILNKLDIILMKLLSLKRMILGTFALSMAILFVANTEVVKASELEQFEYETQVNEVTETQTENGSVITKAFYTGAVNWHIQTATVDQVYIDEPKIVLQDSPATSIMTPSSVNYVQGDAYFKYFVNAYFTLYQNNDVSDTTTRINGSVVIPLTYYADYFQNEPNIPIYRTISLDGLADGHQYAYVLGNSRSVIDRTPTPVWSESTEGISMQFTKLNGSYALMIVFNDYAPVSRGRASVCVKYELDCKCTLQIERVSGSTSQQYDVNVLDFNKAYKDYPLKNAGFSIGAETLYTIRTGYATESVIKNKVVDIENRLYDEIARLNTIISELQGKTDVGGLEELFINEHNLYWELHGALINYSELLNNIKTDLNSLSAIEQHTNNAAWRTQLIDSKLGYMQDDLLNIKAQVEEFLPSMYESIYETNLHTRWIDENVSALTVKLDELLEILSAFKDITTEQLEDIKADLTDLLNKDWTYEINEVIEGNDKVKYYEEKEDELFNYWFNNWEDNLLEWEEQVDLSEFGTAISFVMSILMAIWNRLGKIQVVLIVSMSVGLIGTVLGFVNKVTSR